MNPIFNRILAIEDAYRDSTQALEWAAKIVPANGHVKVVDVQPPLSAFWQELFRNEYEDSPAYHRKKAISEKSRGVVFPTEHVTGQILSGNPTAEIVREAITGGHDLVIKEAWAKASDVVFGSLDMRLLRYCPIPVWLAHPDRSPNACHRVLVALNPDAGENEMKLNERLLRCASSVAVGFDCRLHVVAAFQPRTSAFPILDRESLRKVEQHSRKTRKLAQEKIASLVRASRKAIDPSDIVLADGDPDEVILNSVDLIDPDLLVMGSVARNGLSGLLVGNAAERVIRQVNCSVLTVKPQDFVTPILPERIESQDYGGLRPAF
ncbi:universal stress protein [Mariniblastus fucicola]|nr:universal stress protein [Mariniblastus fucicola]